MARREIVYLILIVCVLIGYYAYSSNENTKVFTIYNHPPVIDRFDITPSSKRVGEPVRVTIAATNRTYREVYDNCGPELEDYQNIAALAARILIEKGADKIIEDDLTVKRSSGNAGVFNYTWTPREPGAYQVTIRLTSANTWVYYDAFHGQAKETTIQQETISVTGKR